jgi:hypothetical protein
MPEPLRKEQDLDIKAESVDSGAGKKVLGRAGREELEPALGVTNPTGTEQANQQVEASSNKVAVPATFDVVSVGA